MRALFLQAPSFDGYRRRRRRALPDEARGEERSGFPTWLAQAAAMVPGSKIIDAPPHDLTFKDIEDDVKAHDLIVIHTSTPSFKSDVQDRRHDPRHSIPTAKIGFIGAKVAVEPQQSMEACAGDRFRLPQRIRIHHQGTGRGRRLVRPSRACPIATPDGKIVHNPEREILMDMDKLPSVLPVYKQLKVEKYFGGYLLHPYMSWYTGRGCKSRCTFCLWPQTIGGHKYRAQVDRPRGRGREIRREGISRR